MAVPIPHSTLRTLAGASSGDYNANLIQAAIAQTTFAGGHVNEAEIRLLQSETGSSQTDLSGLRALYTEQNG